MDSQINIDMMYPQCPIRNVLSRICDKWSMLVLCTLHQQQVMRFGTLQKSIPDISQKMLSATLRSLENDGLVSRKAYAEIPPRVEYALTDRGTSLMPLLYSLVTWAKENMDEIVRHRTTVPLL